MSLTPRGSVVHDLVIDHHELLEGVVRWSRARAVSVLAALVLGAALATGGPGPSATPVAAAAPAAERAPVMPTRVRGVDGRTIVIRSAARIVSLNGDLTETIYALGLGGNLVGVDTSATFPAAAAGVTSIGYQRQLSAEGILALRPTVVIGSTLAGPAPVIAQLKAAGVPTVIIPEDDRLTAPMSKIRSVARILGVPRRGRALADRTQRQIRTQSLTAARAARGVARPRVAFLYLRGSRVQMIGGTGTRSNIIIRLARGIDVLGLDRKGHLGVGADADVTIYTPGDDVQRMFELPRYVIHHGEIVVEQGDIRRTFEGKLLHVEPSYDESLVGEIQTWFEQYYSIQFANYPVDDDYLHEHEVVATGRL